MSTVDTLNKSYEEKQTFQILLVTGLEYLLNMFKVKIPLKFLFFLDNYEYIVASH